MKFILSYFLKGLLFVLPLGLTFWILYELINFIDGLLGLNIPGLGLAIVLAGVTLIGFIFTNIVPNPLIRLMEDAISRMPLVKMIYTSIKDLTEAVLGDKKKFNQPVLVDVNDAGVQRLGFITEESLGRLNLEGKAAVYFPHSYNFSGNLFIVPQDKVQKIDAPASDVMKFIISAGVSNLSELDMGEGDAKKKKPKRLKDYLIEWLEDDR